MNPFGNPTASNIISATVTPINKSNNQPSNFNPNPKLGGGNSVNISNKGI